jgi:hypothetical protein
MRTYKRKMKKGTKPEQTYVEAAEILVKTSNLRKPSPMCSVNFMTLQRFCRRLEDES